MDDSSLSLVELGEDGSGDNFLFQVGYTYYWCCNNYSIMKLGGLKSTNVRKTHLLLET